MKKILLLLPFILGSQFSDAQYSFSGVVIDEKRETLPGVQVMLSINDSLFAAALTDEKGNFSIKNLSKREYELQINYPGYNVLEEKLNLQRSLNTEYMLMPQGNVELDDVMITADRSDYVKRTATGHIFYLSEQAKNSGNPYRALKEIPRLISNEALQKITMEDGSTPLVLIDGNTMNSGVAPIDPKEIESVEIMDVVNARYLRTGAKHILNIKLKKKTAPYTFFETATRHDVPIRNGMGVVYFEIGNQKYSLYSRAAANYTYDNNTETQGWQRGENYYKQNDGVIRENSNYQLGELLFKWKFTEKDYLAAHAYGQQKLKKIRSWGTGEYQTDYLQDFDYTAFNRNDAYILTGSLYHKHYFTDDKTLETTLAYNKNGDDSDEEREEIYPDWRYRNLYKYRNKRSSGSLNIDYSWSWGEVNSLNVGSETMYVNDHINQVSEGYPVFRHRAWNEYLYSAFSSKTGNLFYMASAGIEGIWLRAGNVSNRYIKPRASFSGTYEFSRNHSSRMSYTLTNTAPAVGQLNPYNTSTDSLVVVKGNPELLPVQNHQIESSYTFNKSGWYLTPSTSYSIYTDRIEPFGFSENGIYTSTYRNMGRFKTLTLGGSVSYRLNKWGRIYANAYHHVDYFSGMDPLKSFSCGGGFMATYKKWTFSGDISYQNYQYTPVSRLTQVTPEYSQVQVNYNFTKNFYIAVALPYFWGTLRSDITTHSGTYRSFSSNRMIDQSAHPWILLHYTFRKNNKQKIKLDNIIKSKEKGISL